MKIQVRQEQSNKAIMSTKLQVIENFFEEVWSNENTDMIKELFVPDTENDKTADGLNKEEKLSPDDFIQFQQALLGQVKNMVITVDQHIEDGDWLVVLCTLSAESRTTGKQVEIKGTGWARITDGKIREAQNFFDFLHFFEGLELLPENTFAQCLSGQKAR